MAGMLPGVECARRRRIHPTGALSDSPTPPPYGFTRKPSFCLYTTNQDTHSCLQQRRILDEGCEDEELGGIVREAKKRLDERLRSQRKSQPKRQNSNEIGMEGELQSKKERVSWPKLSWKKC